MKHVPILIILTFALALRLGIGVLLGFNAPPDRAAMGADTVEFEYMAWSASQGEGFRLTPGGELTAFRAPGYPMMLASLYKVFGRTYAVNRIALSLIGAMTCWLVYLLAIQLGLSRPYALLSALITAMLPLQFYYCGHFMSEPLATLLNVATVLLMAIALRGVTGEKEKNSHEKSQRVTKTAFGGKILEQTDAENEHKDLSDLPTNHLSRRSSRTKPEQINKSTTLEGDSLVPTTFQLPKSTTLLFLLAGIVSGLSALTRPASLLAAVVFGGLLLITKGVGFRKAVVWTLLVVFGMAAVIAPWTIRNKSVFDRFCLVSTNGGSTFWGANNPETAKMGSQNWGQWMSTTALDREFKRKEVWVLENEVDRDRKEWERGRLFLTQNPKMIPSLLIGKLYRLVSPVPASSNRAFVVVVAVGHVFLLPACLLGLCFVLKDRRLRGRYLPLFAQLVVMIVTVLIFYGSERFRAPYEPFLAILAAIGVGAMVERIYSHHASLESYAQTRQKSRKKRGAYRPLKNPVH